MKRCQLRCETVGSAFLCLGIPARTVGSNFYFYVTIWRAELYSWAASFMLLRRVLESLVIKRFWSCVSRACLLSALLPVSWNIPAVLFRNILRHYQRTSRWRWYARNSGCGVSYKIHEVAQHSWFHFQCRKKLHKVGIQEGSRESGVGIPPVVKCNSSGIQFPTYNVTSFQKLEPVVEFHNDTPHQLSRQQHWWASLYARTIGKTQNAILWTDFIRTKITYARADQTEYRVKMLPRRCISIDEFSPAAQHSLGQRSSNGILRNQIAHNQPQHCITDKKHKDSANERKLLKHSYVQRLAAHEDLQQLLKSKHEESSGLPEHDRKHPYKKTPASRT